MASVKKPQPDEEEATELPASMASTFAERAKARQAAEKRIAGATNKAVTAAETK